MENTNATETALRIKKENNQQRAAENEVTKYTFYYSVYILIMQYIMWVSKTTANLNGLFQRGPGSKFVLL